MEVDDKTAVATAAPARATANGAGVFMCVSERDPRFESFPSTNAKAQTRGVRDTKTFWRRSRFTDKVTTDVSLKFVLRNKFSTSRLQTATDSIGNVVVVD